MSNGDQQPGDAGHRAGDPAQRRGSVPGAGIGGLAARCRSSWRGTSAMAGCSRPVSVSPWRRDFRYRRRNVVRTPGLGRAGGGPLGAYFPPRCSTRRSIMRLSPPRRADRPWRHRGIRRYRRYGAPGSLRDGILRRGIVRQMHPCRIGSVRGMETVDKSSPARCRCQSGTAARSLPHLEVRIIVCIGWVHSLPGAQCDELFP